MSGWVFDRILQRVSVTCVTMGKAIGVAMDVALGVATSVAQGVRMGVKMSRRVSLWFFRLVSR